MPVTTRKRTKRLLLLDDATGRPTKNGRRLQGYQTPRDELRGTILTSLSVVLSPEPGETTTLASGAAQDASVCSGSQFVRPRNRHACSYRFGIGRSLRAAELRADMMDARLVIIDV